MYQRESFPEPAINSYIREMDGLSRRASFLREALLHGLDEWRAHLYRTSSDSPDIRKEPADVSEDFFKHPMTALISVAELTHFTTHQDKLFRRLVSDLRFDNWFFQMPPDDSASILVDLDNVSRIHADR